MKKGQDINIIIMPIIAILILYFVLFIPYFQAILSNEAIKNIKTDTSVFCKEKNSDLRKTKIVKYLKAKGELQVYCLYNNRQDNTQNEITSINEVEWKISNQRKIGRWFWPFYW